MSAETSTITLTVDGKEVQVEKGTMLIEACKKAGSKVPHFCYHKDLSVAGNCRMCSVEVEKARGMPISCATPVANGMVVRTDTEQVKAHRAAILEFLLINHPIDCPICDQAGECKLQSYYMAHDRQDSRLDVDKVQYQKRMEVGPRVVLDQDRCVECTRCIRFCDEVPKTGELRMVNRGDRVAIATFPGTPLDNDYSVNVVDICPVGALTARDFRFQVRAWFLQEAETICGGCARGCNVGMDYGWHPVVKDYDGKAYRVRPRWNPEVNKSWMCDFGREEYRKVNEKRILETTVGESTVKLQDGVEQAAAALKQASHALVIGSLSDTIEEMHALTRLGAETLQGAEVIAVPTTPDGTDDDVLLRADKHANRMGARWARILAERGELAARLEGLDAVLIHQADILAMDEDGTLRQALQKIPVRVMVFANSCKTTEDATHLLPGCSIIEKDGHQANFDGRLQRLFKGRHMPVLDGAAENLAVISGLSGGLLPDDAHAVFDDAIRSIPELADLAWASAGRHGVMPGSRAKGATV